MFAKCSILWISKLQTQIVLSTIETEYIVLSNSLRKALPLLELIEEIKNKRNIRYLKTCNSLL